jgi:hypothetical protein
LRRSSRIRINGRGICAWLHGETSRNGEIASLLGRQSLASRLKSGRDCSLLLVCRDGLATSSCEFPDGSFTLIGDSSHRRHVVALSVAAYAMSRALKTNGNSFDWSTIRGLGFGNANDLTFMSPAKCSGGFMWHVFIANLFQPLLSCLYFSYNGLFTSMAACMEWESYGRAQKSLRVSARPKGKQRESHFLQLPYRFPNSMDSAFGTTSLARVTIHISG